MSYKVVVDDNFHYMDESERYTHGEYESAAEALSVAKSLVDEDLKSYYSAGMTADDLYAHYTSFGCDPFIISDDNSCSFSARDYAKERAKEFCDNNGKKVLITRNVEFDLFADSHEKKS